MATAAVGMNHRGWNSSQWSKRVKECGPRISNTGHGIGAQHGFQQSQGRQFGRCCTEDERRSMLVLFGEDGRCYS